jgi:type III pantothenate kinase
MQKTNLILDIGNTRSKYYLFENESIIKHSIVADDLQLEKALKTIQFQQMLVSSTRKLPTFLSDYNFTLLQHDTKIPIQLNYQTPKTLGTDRIALAVGANQLYPQKNCLVIGVGTCITYDFIDKSGKYQGGAISPGLMMRFKALNTFTEKLPLINTHEKKELIELIGKTTEQSIESGVYYGIFAEVDGIIAKYDKIYEDLTVILTGGDQDLFEKNLKNTIFAHSFIQAIGLNTILNYNA